MKASTKATPTAPAEARNYAEDMQQFVQLILSTKKTYTATGLAHEVARRLRRSDPDLLKGWLELQAEEILRQFISRQSRSQRAHNRQINDRSTFGEAVKRYAATGDERQLTTWLDCTYTVDENHTKMMLSDMSAPELDYAAGYHQKLADTNAFEAKFLSALARKVGVDTVGEHYTEEQIAEIRVSLRKFSGRRR